jgi:DNA-binding transcriptional LysR family regulator
MDTLVSIRVFCLVAEMKSFAAAADRLGISPAMASKHVMQLERRLSSRLLNRTSRRVSLSETGALYFEQARQMLESLDEIEAVVSKATVVPRGMLKLSAPVWLANTAFVSLLAEYRRRYPQVQLDFDLSGRLVNLVDEGFDLALRMTNQLDEGLIARPIATVAFHMVAAPAYLDRHGRPQTLAELHGHALLKYAPIPGNAFPFSGPQGEETVAFDVVLQSENETLLQLAAVEGMGITFLPKGLIAEDIAKNRLELLLPEALSFQGQMFAVYPSRKYLSAKVRTFIDFIAADPRLK